MMITHDAPKQAASYAHSAEHNALTIEQQHEQNRARAERDGFHILPEHCYSDDGVSGIAATRPGLEGLLKLLAQARGTIQRVYMRDPSRLGGWSDPLQRFHWELRLMVHGADVCYSDGPAPGLPTDRPDPAEVHRFVQDRIDCAIAAEERARLIRRTKAGREHHALQGNFPGSTAPFGTERWLVDVRTGEYVERIPDSESRRRAGCAIRLRWRGDESMGVIRDLYRWIAEEDLSLAACARRLTEQGVLPPGRAACWSAAGVRRIATDPLYAGDLVWGRSTRDGEPRDSDAEDTSCETPLRIRDFLPGAPISRQEFDRVQQVLAGRRRVRKP